MVLVYSVRFLSSVQGDVAFGVVVVVAVMVLYSVWLVIVVYALL